MTLEQDPNNGKPETGDLVDIRYKTILKGHPLISGISNARNEIKYSFVIGSGVVDPQVEEKICGITVGESICITNLEDSDPVFVSEESSFGSEIGSDSSKHEDSSVENSKVIVELLSITKKEQVPDIVTSTKKVFSSPMQRMQLSLDSKNLGNHYYNLGDYQTAKIHYENSIKYLDNFEEWTTEQQNDSKPIKISALLNISNCMIKLEEYKSVLKFCTETLKLDKNNVKALYLRASSYLKLDDPDEARIDLYKAATLEPQNVEVRTKLQQVSLFTFFSISFKLIFLIIFLHCPSFISAPKLLMTEKTQKIKIKKNLSYFNNTTTCMYICMHACMQFLLLF